MLPSPFGCQTPSRLFCRWLTILLIIPSLHSLYCVAPTACSTIRTLRLYVRRKLIILQLTCLLYAVQAKYLNLFSREHVTCLPCEVLLSRPGAHSWLTLSASSLSYKVSSIASARQKTTFPASQTTAIQLPYAPIISDHMCDSDHGSLNKPHTAKVSLMLLQCIEEPQPFRGFFKRGVSTIPS